MSIDLILTIPTELELAFLAGHMLASS